ncbi:DUF1904 domain-containing protein [Anaeromicrobium sediminis]|uniref:DUF1904 domain-containing protein n=1 Tax=Anaeromicrobium sediminis TaxID=1478221 RepID=A0A267MI19_9FIRM|nr:DUF1904 domain-containing protein [Anaeromicrobium sediminis]PAB58515.1 hypothetical protein CCE28_14510 [Anaeromicrobium sediminis]
MPHIRVRGMEKENIKEISKELIDDLEKIIECPRDYFTLECINTTFIVDGEEDSAYPFIDVLWFERGEEVRTKVAKAITERVNKFDYEDVCVMFTNLDKELYYENGEHF